MIYHQRGHSHIVSSLSMSGKKRAPNFLGILGLVVLCIILFLLLRKPVGDILFGMRELIVPSAKGTITLDPRAIESRIGGLEVENNELKQLLLKAGVHVPGYDSQQASIDIADIESVEASATSTATSSEVITSTSTEISPRHALKLHSDELIASVLVRPPQTPYDALVISAGKEDGISIGDQVYAFNGFPIGEVLHVENRRSTVRLFSSPGSKIEVLVGTSTLAVMAEGKGGGNFFLKLPKVTDIHEGDIVMRTFLPPEAFSTITSVDATDGEAYIYAYFKLPININSLIYVLVKKNSAQ